MTWDQLPTTEDSPVYEQIGIPRSAVIATHNRRAELYRCVEALAPQCSHILIIDNATDPPLGHDEQDAVRLLGCADPAMCVVDVIRDPEQPPNLSRLWNLGIDRVAHRWRTFCLTLGVAPRWDVAVVNDDATVPPGWFDALSREMRRFDEVKAACSCPPFDELPPSAFRAYGPTAPMGVHSRLTGWAFVLRGEWEGARFDERFRWWCGDDDISLRARLAGGLVQVGGFPVPNEHADQSTYDNPFLSAQTAVDMAVFVEKWGKRPW